MQDKINSALDEIKKFSAATEDEIEQFRIRYLGRKGLMNDLFEEFKTIAPNQKKVIGQELNTLKNAIQAKLEELQSSKTTISQSEKIDLSRPVVEGIPGSRHPLSIVRKEILDIFSRIGFTVADGPEIEDNWHVFSGLNFPEDHPARDMQDTFFIHKPGESGGDKRNDPENSHQQRAGSCNGKSETTAANCDAGQGIQK